MATTKQNGKGNSSSFFKNYKTKSRMLCETLGNVDDSQTVNQTEDEDVDTAVDGDGTEEITDEVDTLADDGDVNTDGEGGEAVEKDEIISDETDETPLAETKKGKALTESLMVASRKAGCGLLKSQARWLVNNLNFVSNKKK